MKFALIALAAVLLILIGAMVYIYYAAFYTDKKRLPGDCAVPPGEQYEHLSEKIIALSKRLSGRQCERVTVRSCDGLKLSARLYFAGEDAPVAIMLHGYRSNAMRDCGGSADFFINNGMNVLLVDQRSHGMSEGKAATFGIMERYDCLSWIEYARERFGQDVNILLMGLSMGASTVLMAAGLDELPENVKCILADCGFTSPREIISSVIEQMGLPPKPVYPLVRLTALIFCGFDLEATDAPTALAKSKTPVVLIHGEADSFVPCSMSRENFEACASPKKLLTVPEAEHGMSYHLIKPQYLDVLAKMAEAAKGGEMEL